jgi:hypothetical protein
MSTPEPVFWDVKAILDWLTNGSTPEMLKRRHGVTFSWSSKEELLAAVVQLDDEQCTPGEDCFRLIDPNLVQERRGADTNLVKALRDEGGVNGNTQMPPGGNADRQQATALMIDTIVRWIDAGCP